MTVAETRVRRGAQRMRTGARGAWRAFLAELAYAWSLLYVRHGMGGMCLIALGAFTPAFLPPESPLLSVLGLDWLEEGASRVVAAGLVIGGVAVLLHAWLRLRPGRDRAAAPAATWALWSLPVLLAPPLFSRDAYSYAAQGLVVHRGMDPYTTAPISVPGPFADQVDPLWLFTSAPYGPLALQVQHLVTDLAFGNAYLAAIGQRVPAVLAVAVMAYVLPRLAARLGVDPRGAVWLGLLNPLVLLHFVGGAHNDAMMVALVLVGLYLAADGRLAGGALAVALAAGFKQTAMLALVGVAGLVARRLAGGRTPLRRDYLRVCVRTGLTAIAGFVGVTLATGLGWGWLDNLSVPMAVRSLLAPTTLVGSVVELALRVTGASTWAPLAVPMFQALGATVLVVALVWLTLRVGPRYPLGASAGVFAAFVACGPVVHPWYVVPCLALLGLARSGRREIQVAVWITCVLVAYSAFDVALGNDVIMVGIVLIGWTLVRLSRSRTDVVDEPLWDAHLPGVATRKVDPQALLAADPTAPGPSGEHLPTGRFSVASRGAADVPSH